MSDVFEDLPMLELFMGEAAAHAKTLLEGAAGLERTADADLAVSLGRAAHAVAGAAKVVGLDGVAAVAVALEALLASGRERPLSGEETKAALAAAGVFERLGAGPVEELEAVTAAENLDGLLRRLACAADDVSPDGRDAPEESGAPEDVGAPEERASSPASAPASAPTAADAAASATAEAAEEAAAEATAVAADLADLSMLDLFRSELETNSRVLEDGLTALESERSPDAAEPLVRAAHSIRAAAKIVGLDACASLARAMENLLHAVRAGTVAPAVHVGLLSAGNAFFSRLSQAAPEAAAQALAQEADAAAAIVADLETALAAPEAAAPEADAPGPAPAAAAEEGADEGAPEPSAAPPESPEPPDSIPPEPSKPSDSADSAVSTDMADLSMLDLFRMELENAAKVLEEGLVALEEDKSPDKVEPLMRAAHSVKGAARIVGMDPAVSLAHAMEDLLSAAQNGAVALSAGHIDLLLAGNDVFSELGGLDADRIPAALADGAAHLAELEKRLAAALAGSPIPTTPIPTTPIPATPIPATAKTSQSPPPSPTVPAAQASSFPKSAAAQAVKPAPKPAAGKTGSGVVRIAAENLSRLMGLAGECLVEAGGLEAMFDVFHEIKRKHASLGAALASLREGEAALGDGAASFDPREGIVEACEALSGARETLSDAMERFDRYSRRMEGLADRLYNEVIDSRMRPFSDGLHGFSRMVRDLGRDLGKKVSFTVTGRDVKVDREILEKLEAPLTHLLRNAVDHGLETPETRTGAGKPETGTLTLAARHWAGMLDITVSDDGRGLDPERIRVKVVEKGLADKAMAAEMSGAELMEFLFLPGFSTAGAVTEISGRGVGLDVVHTMVRDVGGSVRAESEPGRGMRFFLRLPLTLSVVRTLLVSINNEIYAAPLTRIDRVVAPEQSELRDLEGRQYCVFDGENIGLAPARQILGAPGVDRDLSETPIIVISDRLNRYGLVVDAFLGERDLVVKPLDPRLGKIPCVSAAAVLEDGSPTLILDVDDMVRAVDNLLGRGRLDRIGASPAASAAEALRTKRVLVVDDSLTVREMERRLLANNGYEVEAAVDGMDGFNAARTGRFDLIVTDVDMPRLDGVGLVKKIKADPRLAETPVMIVSYKDREEDRLRGLEAGADYYLTKSSFQDEGLLRAVADLLGEA